MPRKSKGISARRTPSRGLRIRQHADHRHHVHGGLCVTPAVWPPCPGCGQLMIVVECEDCGERQYQCHRAPVAAGMKRVTPRPDDFADL